MTDIYHKVGVLLDDDFFLGTVAAPTGKTGEAANFTLTLIKDGTGNQATTGITLTEVSAANNPGVYHIACNPTTSFVAATGDYALHIKWTTDPSYSWDKTYRITTTGLPTGSSGAASFTATSGDGRITDGTSALSGASIYFKTPAGVPYVEDTSTATGVWGPIAFPSNGTWPFYVQLAGYQVLASSILVSGSTATGPGTDLALTAISASSGVTLLSLKTYARYQVRGNVGTAADAQIVAAINAGLSRVAKAHRWSWLQTDGDLTFNAAYSTGTVTLTNGDATVTLTGGTWPTWAASGKFLYNGQTFRVLSRTSNSEIELTTTWAGTTVSGVSYDIYQNEYTLPTDCMVFGRIYPGMGWGWGSDMISIDSERIYEYTNNFQASTPSWHAVRNNKLVVWPAPSVSKNWPCFYYRKPATLVNNTDEADWDPLLIELLHRAIDVELAIRFGPIMHGDIATCTVSYEKELNNTVNNAKEKGPRSGLRGNSRRQSISDLRLPDAT